MKLLVMPLAFTAMCLILSAGMLFLSEYDVRHGLWFWLVVNVISIGVNFDTIHGQWKLYALRRRRQLQGE